MTEAYKVGLRVVVLRSIIGVTLVAFVAAAGFLLPRIHKPDPAVDIVSLESAPVVTPAPEPTPAVVAPRAPRAPRPVVVPATTQKPKPKPKPSPTYNLYGSGG